MTALVILPTYDERDTLEQTVGAVLAACPRAHVLVVDDASPVGTGAVADDLAGRDERISVLHRPGKQGLGAAYLAGFAWALDRSFDVVVEMDADGSHPAVALPALLASLAHADLALGSRWTPGGGTVGWPLRRRVLSRAGSGYARLALGLPVRDVTGGFRAYRARLLRSLLAHPVASQGYSFQIEMVMRAVDLGARVVELPIVFTDRRIGRSKMSGGIILEAMLLVTRWAIARRLRSGPRARARAPRPFRTV